MTRNFCKIWFIFFLIFIKSISFSYSQTALVAKVSPIGIHALNEKNQDLFDENKIDEKGIFVVEPCFMLGTETFLREDVFSLRFLIGGLSDAASQPAFFLHAGVKQRFTQVYRSAFAIGFGVNFYGRESWESLDGYKSEKGWSKNGSWEYKIGALAELEYMLMLSERHDLLFSAIFGLQPRTFGLTVGYRFWLSTTIKNPKGCGSCPFQQKKWKNK